MKTRFALVPAAIVSAVAAAPAFAQEAVDPLAGKDLTGGITSAQGLVIAALIMIVGFTFMKRALGR